MTPWIAHQNQDYNSINEVSSRIICNDNFSFCELSLLKTVMSDGRMSYELGNL